MTRSANPYLAAREEFISTFGDLARGKRNWQLCAFAALVLLAVVLAAYLRLSLSSRVTPYVVEVDRLGQAVAFGPAEPLRPTDTRTHVFLLALLVHHLRTVSTDAATERDLLFSAYAYLGAGARATLDAYFADPAHDPRVLGRSLTRSVEITAVLRLPGDVGASGASGASGAVGASGGSGASGKTWKVAWRETERPTTAGPLRTAAWEAYLSLESHPPTTTEALLRNPLGLYVTDLTWSEIATSTTNPGAPQ
jgi:type IV secretory pathway TrbF-like protein